MNFIWDTGLPIGNIILNVVLFTLVYGVLTFITCKVTKRKVPLLYSCICYGIALIAFLFNLTWLFTVISCVYAVILCVFSIANIGTLRNFVASPFRKSTVKVKKQTVEKIYDVHSLAKEVGDAVIALSETKTGAIMSFERSSSLTDVTKNGVQVHAPVTKELLETIFYPGTRLHDGAVIIKGNEIIAAAVFFTPSTQPFAVKYGSRHRAALGISEISDAVTVVVSEETGRVSIATNGQLETVSPDRFIRVFENYLSFEAE